MVREEVFGLVSFINLGHSVGGQLLDARKLVPIGARLFAWSCGGGREGQKRVVQESASSALWCGGNYWKCEDSSEGDMRDTVCVCAREMWDTRSLEAVYRKRRIGPATVNGSHVLPLDPAMSRRDSSKSLLHFELVWFSSIGD